MSKIHLNRPIIVEGKYDKIKLSSIIDSEIIVTDGFCIFKSEEKKKYIARLSEKNGIIILTDSDNAGMMIRNCLKSFIKPEKIVNLYIPQVKGKEKRKTSPSAEGFLGVEGIDIDLLRKVLGDFESKKRENPITKIDLYNLGLTGREGSLEKRKKLCAKLGLPESLSSSELLDALNLLITKEEFERVVNES